ncbi:hypothetical protein TrCOL_g5309 [Triparma columacea]|uniref:Uncharacterized protein n=1 Tax=Triparma columacea TaxID=722753 RepID=A0A9W7GNA9_9STRA|nr:hypothetical protein TrCOL_g5309 [Triparma columacea]
MSTLSTVLSPLAKIEEEHLALATPVSATAATTTILDPASAISTMDIDSAEGQSKNVEAAAVVDNVVNAPSQPSTLSQLVTQLSNQQPQPPPQPPTHLPPSARRLDVLKSMEILHPPLSSPTAISVSSPLPPSTTTPPVVTFNSTAETTQNSILATERNLNVLHNARVLKSQRYHERMYEMFSKLTLNNLEEIDSLNKLIKAMNM